jgi:shikimate kinase
MNIFLIGFMGCGKNYWAQKLAQHLAYSYIDSDEEISKSQNLSIPEIFKTKGEDFFREEEKKWLESFNRNQSVVAVGGGLPVFNNNIDKLLKKGKVLWINDSFEAMYQRIKDDSSRPLSNKSKQELEKLYQDRVGVYSKAIEIKSPKTIEDFIANISSIINYQ